MQTFIFPFVVLTLVLTSALTVSAKRIAIVGAGLAGLTAATDLQQALAKNKELSKKHSIVVFEAKDRPGGRVFTVFLNDKTAELGGQNFEDGGDFPTIKRLAKQFSLKIQKQTNPDAEKFFYDEVTGTRYSYDKDFAPVFPLLKPTELKETLARLAQQSANLAQVIDAFFATYDDQMKEKKPLWDVIKRSVFESMHEYEGGSPQVLSPRYAHGSLLSLLGRFLRDPSGKQKGSVGYSYSSIPGGNSKLVLAMTKKLGNRVKLRSPVREISRDENGFRLKIGDHVETDETADIVLLAVPAKVLSKIKFSSQALESERLAKIATIQYASHAKILFPDPQASRKRRTFNSDNLLIWTARAEPWFTLFLSGSRGIMSTPEDYVAALKRASLITDKAIDVRDEINAPTEPSQIFSKHNGAVVKSWPVDPDIGGSYSFYSADLREELEQSISHDGETVLPLFVPTANGLYFAGEHTTTQQDIRGTMEAAAESGAKAARMILKSLSL